MEMLERGFSKEQSYWKREVLLHQNNMEQQKQLISNDEIF
jgi:hypothetical protein